MRKQSKPKKNPHRQTYQVYLHKGNAVDQKLMAEFQASKKKAGIRSDSAFVRILLMRVLGVEEEAGREAA